MINLSYCEKITDQGLKYLTTEKLVVPSSKIKRVQIIQLYGCNQITDQCLQYLRKNGLIVYK